ncbi:SMI1/KNR4 family protein [Hymenobacter weizhouensis]|uniref:SMI1/KNR4 family protein n=1 Tax=Hymenobacter sp. YIM 151500-1 TaxID=2987689 RepID=UPI002227E51F|nr:SMI1/KNR4 family protein [Hymenobacter sp. YIM 151500-1]UYZ63945.1 SMI1/KNR4 family protein [Hymenobacter sp. YIM 151500-1]
MEQQEFTGTEAPATAADLRAIEQEYGFVFPEDYKAHILRVNGGWPRRNTFLQSRENGRTTERDINQFKPVQHGSYTLERSLESLRDQLHPDLIPFADEAGGDQFCLSVGPEDYGSVYYIAHESYRPPAFLEDDELVPQPREYGEGVHFLAPSFTAFLEGLIEVPDEDDEDEV